MKVGKLFVLGAGASYSATGRNPGRADPDPSSTPRPEKTPLDVNFIKALIAMKDQNYDPWVKDRIKYLEKSWAGATPWKDWRLEEAIQAQVANTEFLKHIARDYGPEPADMGVYLDSLVHLIALRLSRSRMRGTEAVGSEAVYEKFVDDHFGEETENRIITFNYDDALDTIMLPVHGGNNLEGFRRVYFSGLREAPGVKTARDDSNNPVLLKLHGSVNWFCGTDDYRRVFHDFEGDSSGRDGDADLVRTTRFDLDNIWYSDTVPKFGDGHSPCIIPPVASKPVAKIPAFRNLWRAALRYLNNCEELYFCGYSLPQTDSMARALFSNFRSPSLRKVVVVDKEQEVSDRLKEIILPRNPKVDWDDRHKDFSVFVEKS